MPKQKSASDLDHVSILVEQGKVCFSPRAPYAAACSALSRNSNVFAPKSPKAAIPKAGCCRPRRSCAKSMASAASLFVGRSASCRKKVCWKSSTARARSSPFSGWKQPRKARRIQRDLLSYRPRTSFRNHQRHRRSCRCGDSYRFAHRTRCARTDRSPPDSHPKRAADAARFTIRQPVVPRLDQSTAR